MQSLGNSTTVQKDGEDQGFGDGNSGQKGQVWGKVRNNSNIDAVKNADEISSSNSNEDQKGYYNLPTDGSRLPSNNITVNKLVSTDDENINAKNNSNYDNSNINVHRGASNPPNQLATSSRSAGYCDRVQADDSSMNITKTGSSVSIKPGCGLGSGSQVAAAVYGGAATNPEEGSPAHQNEKGLTGTGALKPLMVPAGHASAGGLPSANNCCSTNAISASTHDKHKCLGNQAFYCDHPCNKSTEQDQFPKQQQQRQNEEQKQTTQHKTQRKTTSSQNSNQQQALHTPTQADQLVRQSNSRAGGVNYPDYNPKHPTEAASGRQGSNSNTTGYNNFNDIELNDYPAQSDCDEIDYNPNIINDSISNNVPLVPASSGDNIRVADGCSFDPNKPAHNSELSLERKASQLDCLSDCTFDVNRTEGVSSNTADKLPNHPSQLYTQPGDNNLLQSYINCSLPPPPAYSSCIIATNTDTKPPELLAEVCSSADQPNCFPDPLTGIYPTSPIDFSSLFTQPIMRKLNFIDESDNFEKLADFLVVPEGSSSLSICNKLFHEWGLETPKLIISVSGWACQMPAIPPRQHNRFKQGLLRIVQSTNTWILSSGITQGKLCNNYPV